METTNSPMTMLPEEVAKHDRPDDLYLIISGTVYNCTKFAKRHPGGADALLGLGGQDATEAFDDTGHSDEARKMLERMRVGVLAPVAPTTSSTRTKGSSGSTVSPALGAWPVALMVLVCGLVSCRYHFNVL